MHPKYGWNGTVSRVFPLIALIALGAFFHSTPGSAQKPCITLEKRPAGCQHQLGFQQPSDFGQHADYLQPQPQETQQAQELQPQQDAQQAWDSLPFFAMKPYHCCDIVGLLQESKNPLPRKLRKKSEKGFPGPVKKTRKRAANDKFSIFLGGFPFSTFFELFRPRGREVPGTPFQTFFGVFYGEAFLTPVKGQRCRNTIGDNMITYLTLTPDELF